MFARYGNGIYLAKAGHHLLSEGYSDSNTLLVCGVVDTKNNRLKHPDPSRYVPTWENPRDPRNPVS